MLRRLLVASVLALAVPASADEGAVPLIDEDSIGTWRHEGASRADYRFENGVVTGRPIGHEPENAFLCSPREYTDFELSFAFRIAPASLNSGLQFRSLVREDGIVAGPQFEMEVENPADIGFVRRWLYPVGARLAGVAWRPRYWAAAGVYGEGLEMGWIFPGEAGGDADRFQQQGHQLTRPEGWNQARIEAIGPHVRTWLAGEPRADYRHEATAGPGLICLQVHGGSYEDPSAYRVEWKDLRILER